jgi:cytochrome c oxidase subunit II
MSAQVSPTGPDDGAEESERVERYWAAVALTIMILLVVMAVVGGLHQATMPQAQLQTVDPRTLHLQGEFIESNLGSAVESDGSVTVRLVGQQFSFTPQCILVPTDTPITFRATSSEVVHGFLITGTTINLMLVPGYVSGIAARFDTPGERHMPCQEFCGLGHEGMWAEIKIIDKATFMRMAATAKRLSCVK